MSPTLPKWLWLLPALLTISCEQNPLPFIIAHRAQGVHSPGENLLQNVVPVLRGGFGVELDVRGDGVKELELGHLEPSGESLDQALQEILENWHRDFAGLPLVIDIANDSGNKVSDILIERLHQRTANTQLSKLHLVIQTSSRHSIASMETEREKNYPGLQLDFALTYWASPQYTTIPEVDHLTTNVTEVGNLPYPKTLLLFGLESRAKMRQAQQCQSEVFGLLTDHPRRVKNFLDGR